MHLKANWNSVSSEKFQLWNTMQKQQLQKGRKQL